MTFAAIDIALRAAAIALLLVLAASLFRDFRHTIAGRLAIAFALGSAAHAATSAIGVTLPISLSHAPLIALSTRLSIVAINLLALGFIALAVGQTIASWSADLVEGRRRLRVFIVSAAALYGGLNAILQIFVSAGGAADIANVANAALLVLIVAGICFAMMQVTATDLFAGVSDVSVLANPPVQAATIPDPNASDQKLIDALMRLMANE